MSRRTARSRQWILRAVLILGDNPLMGGAATSMTPCALLTMPEYCGTLAAARCLGEAGVQVWVAGEAPLTTAGYSRSVTRRMRCPPIEDAEHMMHWLVEVGGGADTVLYPT